MPGCKTTTIVRTPKTAAIAPQRNTGQGFQRRPAATRGGSAITVSAGMMKAVTSRQFAHWLRWFSTCVRSPSVRALSANAASTLASGCSAPPKAGGPTGAPEDFGASGFAFSRASAILGNPGITMLRSRCCRPSFYDPACAAHCLLLSAYCLLLLSTLPRAQANLACTVLPLMERFAGLFLALVGGERPGKAD